VIFGLNETDLDTQIVRVDGAEKLPRQSRKLVGKRTRRQRSQDFRKHKERFARCCSRRRDETGGLVFVLETFKNRKLQPVQNNKLGNGRRAKVLLARCQACNPSIQLGGIRKHLCI
jgi:hypothetical protein